MAFVNLRLPSIRRAVIRATRPYTRGKAFPQPSRPPDVRDVAAKLKQGLRPIAGIGGEASTPAVAGVGAGVGAVGPAAAQPQLAQKATAAATAGAQADALAQYVKGITDPQERAYVEAQIGPQIVELNAQRDALNREVAAEQAALQGFTQALIDQIKGIDFTTPYAQIAGTQVKAGKAAGESLAAANPNGGTQAILKAIGAPESQMQQLENLGRDVFSGGGAVLTGTGGTIPSFQTAGEGVGVLGFAAAQPTIAAAYGQESMRQLLAQAAQERSGFDTDLQKILAAIPGYRQEYASQQQTAEKQREGRAMTLYNAGFYTQRQLAHELGLPDWQRYPDTVRDQSHPIVTTGRNGHRIVVDPSSGKIISDLGPTGAPKAEKPTKLEFKTINGRLIGVDPYTGQKVVDLGPAGSPKAAGLAAKMPKVDMPLSRALGTWVDSSGAPIPALRNAKPPTPMSGLKPTKAAKGPGTAPRLVRGQWVTRTGRKLTDPNAVRYWSGLYRDGYTDGKGHILKPPPPGYTPGEKGGGGAPPWGKAEAAAESAAANYLVSEARKWLGTPYSWGGGSPSGPTYGIKQGAHIKGFDCSAFVQFIYAKEGVVLPRTTYEQIKVGRSVLGQPLQPGDILFFGTKRDPHHEALYIGNGQFIEEPFTGGSARISSLSDRDDLVDARRILGGSTQPSRVTA